MGRLTPPHQPKRMSKRGRPKSETPLEKKVQVRILEDEYKDFELIAAHDKNVPIKTDGRPSLSEAMRRMIRRYIQEGKEIYEVETC